MWVTKLGDRKEEGPKTSTQVHNRSVEENLTFGESLEPSPQPSSDAME